MTTMSLELRSAYARSLPNSSLHVSLISIFHDRLRREERDRRTAFVTFGQKDLLEPKAKVLKRQRLIQKRLDDKPTADVVEFHATKQARYFPWLESEAA